MTGVTGGEDVLDALATTLDTLESARAADAAAQTAKRQRPPVDPVLAAAAAVTGMKPSEITAVSECREGTLIVTKAGVEYLVVPDDRPDDDGKTGLMFRWPHPKITSFPTYVPHGTRVAERRAQQDAECEAARRLGEAEAARESEQAAQPTSPFLLMLLANDADTAAAIDARRAVTDNPADNEVFILTRRRDALKVLMDGESALLRSQQPPPPATPQQVAYFVDVAAWARAMAAAMTPREVHAVHVRYPKFQFWQTYDEALERELTCAIGFLAHEGLDEHGEPLVDVAPPTPPRRRRLSLKK